LNGTCQLLIYTGEVNLLGENIHTVKKTQKLSLLVPSKEVNPEINAYKYKYCTCFCLVNEYRIK
jgi:hypothetical protein